MKRTVLTVRLLLFLAIALYIRSSLEPTMLVNKAEGYDIVDWTRYHDYAEVARTLLVLNETYPQVVDVFTIGYSLMNRPIYCVRLTNENDPKPKPEVFFVGAHHANERIASELPLYFVVSAAEDFGSNGTITALINQSEIYVVVALNVDGMDLFNSTTWYRARCNAEGVDLNRNYGYAWNGSGSAPFSEPETRAIRDFVLKHHFTYAMSFHSGAEMILYPWGHTPDPAPDEATFIEISKNLSEVTQGTQYGQGSRILYITRGDWDDWMYAVAGVYAFTAEIYRGEPLESSKPIGDSPGEASRNRQNAARRSEIRYEFNPYPEDIRAVVSRWLPVFFYLTNRTVSEAVANSP